MSTNLPRFRDDAAPEHAESVDDQTVALHVFGAEDSDVLGRPAPDNASALTRCAWPLLQVLVYVGAGWSAHSLPVFKTRLIDMLHQFGRQADLAACPPEAVTNVRYILCTALDEAVMQTEWGNNTVWSDRTLLSWFYDQTWGGDKSFKIIEQALQNDQRDVLEVALEILLLGFQGRFRTERDGSSQVHLLTEKIFRTFYPPPPTGFGNYAPEAVVASERKRLTRYVPIWWFVVLSIVVLSGMVIWFGAHLNQINMHLQQEFKQMETGIPNGAAK
ncbi:MAG: type IVB secretion system protein IcmH/DotU [Acetobacter sp.]